MSTAKTIVRAMRLRTLPIPLSGVCLGILLAAADYRVSLSASVLTVLTAALLQILSNLPALPDGDRSDVRRQRNPDGADAGNLPDGCDGRKLTSGTWRFLTAALAAVCIVSGICLLRVSFGTIYCMDSVCLMMLGCAAVTAAVKHSARRESGGHTGTEYIYAFLFFGPAAVLGSYFVVSHTIGSWLILLPACSMGFLSVAALNAGARVFQTCLIALGWICMSVFCLCRFPDPWHWVFVLSAPLFCVHLRKVWTGRNGDSDSTVLTLIAANASFALLAGFGFVKFLLF